MRNQIFRIGIAFALLWALAVLASNVHAGKSTAANVFDESADGSKQVAAALATAHKENKRVLLHFGANWCPLCRELHALYGSDTNVAAILRTSYVLVMIDVNKGHNRGVDYKYGHPTRDGIPALVILDSDGKKLTTEQADPLFDNDRPNPARLLAFLKQWAPQKS